MAAKQPRKKNRYYKLVKKQCSDAGINIKLALAVPDVAEQLYRNYLFNGINGITPCYVHGEQVWYTASAHQGTMLAGELKALGQESLDKGKQYNFRSNMKPVDVKWTGETGWRHTGPFGVAGSTTFYPGLAAAQQKGPLGVVHYYMGYGSSSAHYSASNTASIWSNMAGPIPFASTSQGANSGHNTASSGSYGFGHLAFPNLCIMSPNAPNAGMVAGINNPYGSVTETKNGRPVYRFHIPTSITGNIASASNPVAGQFGLGMQQALSFQVVQRIGTGETLQFWCSGSSGLGKLTSSLQGTNEFNWNTSPSYASVDWECSGSGSPAKHTFVIPTGVLPMNIVYTGTSPAAANSYASSQPHNLVQSGFQIFVHMTASGPWAAASGPSQAAAFSASTPC